MTSGNPDPDPRIDVVDDDGHHVAAEIPGASGHHLPGERAELVDKALEAEPVRRAEKVTVVVPRGDHEALEQAQKRLGTDNARSAGASVVVEAVKPPVRDGSPAPDPGLASQIEPE
jgi:hypothetical protein